MLLVYTVLLVDDPVTVMTDEVLDTIVGVKVTPKYMSIINEVTHDSITWWYWLSPLSFINDSINIK